MIKCFEANYPESLGVVLIHRSPWIFQGISTPPFPPFPNPIFKKNNNPNLILNLKIRNLEHN